MKNAPVALTRDDKKRLFPAPTVASGAPRISIAQRKRETVLFLAERQQWICFWCGQKMCNDDPASMNYRTLEHVIPRATGYKNVSALDNLRAACHHCNNMRGSYNISVAEKEIGRLKQELAICQKTLERHRITMAGRCLYCKVRFYVKEWLLDFKAWRKTR